MNPKTHVLLIGLLILFVVVRLPGLSVPYQQDEFKTAIAAEAGLSEASSFLTHPPLTAFLLRADALVFGGENLRIMPLMFGFISAVLLFFVVRRRFDERAAMWALFLYAVSFYGIWSSLMLDTDGAILPTFFLLSVYSYDRRRWWLLCLALLLGLMVKLSFILVVGALLIDFLWANHKTIGPKQLFCLLLALLSFFGLTTAAILIVSLVYPAFSISGMIE